MSGRSSVTAGNLQDPLRQKFVYIISHPEKCAITPNLRSG